LIAIARTEKLRRLHSTILAENREMRAICQKLGFRMTSDVEDGTVCAQLDL
jgi:RimJ/RimL family protein N-acetyltransferase